MARKYIPRRGDLVWTDFNPAARIEQMGKRPAIVLSKYPFNEAPRRKRTGYLWCEFERSVTNQTTGVA